MPKINLKKENICRDRWKSTFPSNWRVVKDKPVNQKVSYRDTWTNFYDM